MAQDLCGKCGNAVQPTDRFCRECGSPLDSTDTSTKHSPSKYPRDHAASESAMEPRKTITNKVKNWWLIGLLAGLIPCLYLFFSTNGELGGAILLGSAGIPSGLIGAAIGNVIGKKNDVVLIGIGAIVGAFLGTFLWVVVFLKGGIY